MKRVLVIILVCGLWAGANAQAKTDKSQSGLLGAVQTVTTEVMERTSKNGRSVGGQRVLVHTVAYDTRGNKVKRIVFNLDGSVAQTFVYTYDAEGRGTGYEEYTGGLSTPRRHVYVLDQNGDRTEYGIIQPDGSAGEKYLYKYDTHGNKVAEALYHKGALISRNENSYDDEGRLLSQTIYNSDGTVSSRSRNSNDPEGKPIERIRHDDDVLTYRVRYTYDGKGRLVELETVGSFVETDVSDSAAYVAGKVVYRFKDKDRPNETMTYNQDGSLRERVVIAYDSRGNWVKKTHLVQTAMNAKEVPPKVEYRTITYHPGRSSAHAERR